VRRPFTTTKAEKAEMLKAIETDPQFRKPMAWGPRRKPVGNEPPILPAAVGGELIELSLDMLFEADEVLPPDLTAISAAKASISIGGAIPAISVRQAASERYDVLDGHAVVVALRELGKQKALVTVIAGLTDADASLWRLSSRIHGKLSRLDKAIIYDRLKDLTATKVAQFAPPGGKQPNEMNQRKFARLMKLSKEEVQRSSKIARIAPQVQREIRKLKLANKQDVLLQVAKAGGSVADQISFLRDLAGRKRVKTPRPSATSFSEQALGQMTVSPDVLGMTGTSDRGADQLNYRQIVTEWENGRLRWMLTECERRDRERFVKECILPMVGSEGPSGAN